MSNKSETPEKLPHATHKGVLTIGDIRIPCFVLDDGRRVISGRGMTAAIGMKGRGQGIARIVSHRILNDNGNKDLTLAIQSPISFTGGPRLGGVGYEATVLQELCEAILVSRDKGELKSEQELRYGQFADTLIRAFARVGIIALVDEATGYQEVRDRLALQEILDKYLSEDLQPWTKTFPYEFYQRIFKLKRWPGPDGAKRPSVIGHYTNDFVYDRLAPGVLQELKQKNPRLPSGNLKNRHHQWFTPDLGHPRLKEHLAAVIALMRAAPNWDAFIRSLKRAFPKSNENTPLSIDINC